MVPTALTTQYRNRKAFGTHLRPLTACVINLGLDHCIAGDCNVHLNPICGCILSQHALEDYTIKFESNSFRILLSAGTTAFKFFDTVEDAVSSLSQSQKSEGTKLCPNFLK